MLAVNKNGPKPLGRTGRTWGWACPRGFGVVSLRSACRGGAYFGTHNLKDAAKLDKPRNYRKISLDMWRESQTSHTCTSDEKVREGDASRCEGWREAGLLISEAMKEPSRAMSAREGHHHLSESADLDGCRPLRFHKLRSWASRWFMIDAGDVYADLSDKKRRMNIENAFHQFNRLHTLHVSTLGTSLMMTRGRYLI